MDEKIYQQMAEVEVTHWWFEARRRIIESIIQRLHLPDSTAIFEVGCGTGGNLPMLARHGTIWAMESDAKARDLANRLRITSVQAGFLPTMLPFPEQQFDLITLLDVLEHLEHEVESLLALRSRLKSGGWLLITVPALPWLWSEHDEVHHHYRRYLKSTLQKVVLEAGYSIEIVSYFNSVLLPLVMLTRLFQRFLGRSAYSDLKIPSPWLNRALLTLFASERHLIGRIPFPGGVSLLLLARKTEAEKC